MDEASREALYQFSMALGAAVAFLGFLCVVVVYWEKASIPTTLLGVFLLAVGLLILGATIYARAHDIKP